MKKLLLIILCASTQMIGNAQETEKKDIKKEVTVDVDDQEGRVKKVVKVKVNENGKEKVMEWDSSQGEMPEGMKEMMDDVNVIILDGGDSSSKHKDRSVSIDKEVINGEEQITVKIIETDIEGEKKVILWSGKESDEKPAEIEEALKDSEQKKSRSKFSIRKERFSDQSPSLGVMVEPHLDGMIIERVIEGSVASQSGLLEGDIIYQVNDKMIGNRLQLKDAIESNAGKQVSIKYKRDGTSQDTMVKLDEKKE